MRRLGGPRAHGGNANKTHNGCEPQPHRQPPGPLGPGRAMGDRWPNHARWRTNPTAEDEPVDELQGMFIGVAAR